MTNCEKHIGVLGFQVRDKVTGFEGVVESVAFDLYGCIQAIVVPPTNPDFDKCKSRWFDLSRLEIKSGGSVMQAPDFSNGKIAEGNKGPAIKPEK
jgi:hypothetical protein